MPSYAAQVDIDFPIGSGGGTNVWHFRTGVDFLPDDDINPIMGWVEDFYQAVAQVVPSGTTFSWDGQIREILTSAPAYTPAATGWSVTGTVQGSTYTAAAGQACVTWRSELASRSGRGRTFIGPLASTSVEANGTLSSNALLSLRNAASALVGQSNTNDNVGALGVFSRTDNLLRDIVGSSVTDQVAILRSRRG